MKSVVILFSLLALAAAGPVKYKHALMHRLQSGREARIIGGVVTTIEQHPWQISLLLWGGHHCGGTIINPTHILTTAECAEWDTTDYQIRAGSTSRLSGGQVIRVVDKRSHPNYNYDNRDYDIAVLKLASALTLGPGVAPIALASSRAPDGDKSTVSGWGGMAPAGGEVPNDLRVATTPIINQATCRDAYMDIEVTDRQVCAGNMAGGVDRCTGDEGGPLVASNGKLVGLASWGVSCGLAGWPGVYTSIPEVKPWIDANSNF